MKDSKTRYTRKNKNGIKMKSTLLIQLTKMQNLQKQASTNKRLRGQHDWEKTLNKMAISLTAIKRCPPRHYGKQWNEEKEIILNQATRIYEDALKYANYDSPPFMGNSSDLAGPSDRYISISRIKWNPQENGWDYSHSKDLAGDQYWKPQGKKPVKIIKQGTPEHDWARLDYQANRDYFMGHKRVVPNGGAKLTRDGSGFTDCGGNGRFGQRIIVKNGY